MQSYYPDPDGMLADICNLCSISTDLCGHTSTYPPHCASTITAATLLNHPAWPHDSRPVLAVSPEPEVELQPAFLPSELVKPQLYNNIIERLNNNATTILHSTVQNHVEDIYTPGDRVAQEVSRQHIQKRQASRRDGFPCSFDGCGKTYNRSCDLRRHQKFHLDRSERPHKCSICNEGFLYPKDRNRHQSTHREPSSPLGPLYHCNMPHCANTEGFSRRDNLLRHQRNKHKDLKP